MTLRALGLFFCVLAAGCAGGGDAPAQTQAEGVALKPAGTIAEPPAAVPAPDPVAGKAPASVAAPVPAKAAEAPAPVAPPARPAAAAPAVSATAKPAPATIDLPTLETRLRNTKAIGVFTKLTLKNQVDDLLVQVRAMHQNKGKPSPSQVRQSYDLLLLKVLALLQDGDPPLANAVAVSREPLWGVLSDPVKFASIN